MTWASHVKNTLWVQPRNSDQSLSWSHDPISPRSKTSTFLKIVRWLKDRRIATNLTSVKWLRNSLFIRINKASYGARTTRSCLTCSSNNMRSPSTIFSMRFLLNWGSNRLKSLWVVAARKLPKPTTCGSSSNCSFSMAPSSKVFSTSQLTPRSSSSAPTKSFLAFNSKTLQSVTAY